MFKQVGEWLEARTGYRGVMHEALDEPIPGGARVRYVFGSCLTASFLVQAVTGVLLMTSYSPSSTTAWGSVYHITYQLDFGWFVRGLHHFGAQAMIVLLGMHLIQVLLAGAYRAPREFNWWFGLLLMVITMGLGLTGYLLPWDQKGYWATKVATNIMGNTPVIGDSLRKLVVGGNEYGNATLTRFYALHVAVLPAALVGLLVVHIALFRKNGITHPPETRGRMDTFWPKQVFLDTVAVALVIGGIAGWVWWEQSQGRAAPLDAPADPSSSDYEARPEWYFLSLFQMLKRPEFSGANEVIGTVVVPSAVFLVLILLPLFDKLLPRRLAHFLACGVVFVLIGGAGYLTWQAFDEDARNPKFQAALERAHQAGLRAKDLAQAEGITPEGAGYLLARDPMTRGRAVLEQKCLSCHYYNGHGQISRTETLVDAGQRAAAKSLAGGLDLGLPQPITQALGVVHPGFMPQKSTSAAADPRMNGPGSYQVEGTNERGDRIKALISSDGGRVVSEVEPPQTASDLKHFGSPAWLRGLLQDPSHNAYFGAVKVGAGGMKSWKKESKLDERELDRIAEFFEAHVINTPADLPAAEWVERENVTSHPAFKNFGEKGECFLCHADWVASNPEAPNLYGWGSDWWIRRMILRPRAPHNYGFLPEDEANQMPGFAGGKITDAELDVLVRFLKDDYLGAEPPPDVGSRRPRPVDPR